MGQNFMIKWHWTTFDIIHGHAHAHGDVDWFHKKLYFLWKANLYECEQKKFVETRITAMTFSPLKKY